jgi:hypothetical protein
VLVWLVGLIVFACGCFGGFVNALLTGELKLPHRDPAGHVYSPGWIGNVISGGVAALVFWGLYGPLAKNVIVGPGSVEFTFTLSELAGSIVTGIGGGRLLTSEIEKKALMKTKDILVEQLSKTLPGENR